MEPLCISELDHLAQRARSPRRTSVGATVEELSATLRLGRLTIGRHFNTAAVGSARGGRRTLFSRGDVSSILSELNGRAIGYPDAPLLTLREVVKLGAELGVPLTLAAVNWAAWRAAHAPAEAGHTATGKNTGPAPILPSVLVSPKTRRVADRPPPTTSRPSVAIVRGDHEPRTVRGSPRGSG